MTTNHPASTPASTPAATASSPSPAPTASGSVPSRSQFRYVEPLRVRWAEVDLQKIVFNGHYLMYFDTAVAGWWRAMAMPYHDTMHALAGDFYVRRAGLEYEASAVYDDVLGVGVRCAHLGNSSMRVVAAVFRGSQCLVHGELIYVFADPATQKSKPMPASLRDWLTAFEAGESMVKIEVADTQEAHEAGAHLREIALVNGLGLPESVAQDQVAGALSVVARNRLGLCVATARLEPVVLVDGVATAQVARVAVHPALRGAGVGRALIDAARSHAHQLGANRLTVQAQVDAVPFFRRLGMKPVAEPFVALGIPHQAMALDLAG